ncbi:MAG: glucose-1-phosphate cytidylyltransferase [Nitrospina sp.]|jgi:glucose-1-phosphate cytidylyltransferase|nr:glucose-1-phosphate cytidylyltransferase [Nitrospina sp.]
MKAVILAGGLGTRLGDETGGLPKPMIEIGGKPLLWHIMKSYSFYGINDFIICLGHNGYIIKEYFANYFLHVSDVTFDIANNLMEVHEHNAEPWKITLIDTEDHTQTGGRLKRVASYLGDEDFCLTYGDGLSDVDIKKEVAFHKKEGGLATLMSVQPPGRFGTIKMDSDNKITGFQEKPLGADGWVNGGFYVVSPKAIDYIEDDKTRWEGLPLEKLEQDGRLSNFPHHGFWQILDTLRDKVYLEELWNSNKAPWKSW